MTVNSLAEVDKSVLTAESFKKVLPPKVKDRVTPEMLEQINGMMEDEILREMYRDNLIGFTEVLKDGKFKLQAYVDAVRYVSFKMMGSTNIDAYTRTFPERYERLVANNTSQKDIASYVNSYNKNILVQKVFEQTLIPTHILNADVYQEAINVQADLMRTARSEKVRTDAANSLLHHLKRPEAAKIELDMTYKDDSAMEDLKNATLLLAQKQKEMLEGGVYTAKEVAESNVVKTISKED